MGWVGSHELQKLFKNFQIPRSRWTRHQRGSAPAPRRPGESLPRPPNPIGEDVYLESDGVTVTRDEDKIIKVQRIFKNNYYKPGGKGALRVLKRLREAN